MGATIGLSLPEMSSVIGIALVIISLLLLFLSTENIDDIVNQLYTKIEVQKKEHRGNLQFVKGLQEIKAKIGQEVEEYQQEEREQVKQKIVQRLRRWDNALERRADVFFHLPYHVGGVADLPDRGLYDYHPLPGRKSGYVELTVTHYTNQQRYHRIKENFERGKRQIMFHDQAGWAYFVAQPLPGRLETKEARTILGTGFQDYVPFPKTGVRNPESLVTLTIRLPRERVLTRQETYTLRSGEKITVTKYAIAGGISSGDIVQENPLVGGRYLNKGLEERYAHKERWNSPKSPHRPL